MQNFGVNLADQYSSGAATDRPVQQWPGGKAALVMTATAYPATCTLRYATRRGFLDLQAVAVDGMYILDLPAGLYFLHLVGVATNLTADLVNVPQG